LLRSPRLFRTTYRGIINNDPGRTCVIRIKYPSAFLPGNLKRDNPKPPIEAIRRENNVVLSETIKLFLIQILKSKFLDVDFNMLSYPDIVGLSGIKLGS
jgi:hypothetical protein